MRAVFHDEYLERQFQKNGYVRIPFISNDEVDILKTKFFELLPVSGGNITASETGVASSHDVTYDFTFIDKNIAYKQAVFEVITQYFAPHVEHWLANYEPIIANYIRKQNDTGEVPLHQNWAFADERKVTTVSIWCPLVDSNEQNGTLQVVPGSHKRFGEIRGPMVPWELYDIRHEIVNNYLVPLNLKAGEAIILDDSIVHYSAINKTNDLRLAIQLILIPEEVPSLHYHMNPSTSNELVNVLEVDKAFYMQFNPWKKPDHAKTIKTIKYKHNPLTVDVFEKRLKGPRIDEQPTGVLAKLKAIFT